MLTIRLCKIGMLCCRRLDQQQCMNRTVARIGVIQRKTKRTLRKRQLTGSEKNSTVISQTATKKRATARMKTASK